MRQLAVILVFALFFYLAILKPFLEEKDFDFDIKGVKLRSDPPSVEVESFYIYFRTGSLSFFAGGRDFSLGFSRKLFIDIGEGSVVVVSEVDEKEGKEEAGEKKREIELGVPPIPEFLKEAQIQIRNFTYTSVGAQESVVSVRNLAIEDRTLRGSVEFLTSGLWVSTLIERVVFTDDSVKVERLTVRSDFFEALVEGEVVEGEVKGGFRVRGKYYGLSSEHLYIPPVGFTAEGVIDPSGLVASLQAEARNLRVRRRIFREVKASGELKLDFGGRLRIEGALEGDDLEADLDLKIAPEGLLSINVKRIFIDDDLLGIDRFIYSWAEGDVRINLLSSKLEVFLQTSGMEVEELYFTRGEGSFILDYSRLVGKFSAYLQGTGDLILSGNITPSGVRTRFHVRDVFLARGPVSGSINAVGEAGYEKGPFAEVRGVLRGVSSDKLIIGDIDYEVVLREGNLEALFKGEGFEGKVGGSIPEEMGAEIFFKNFKRYYGDIGFEVNGEVSFKKSREKWDFYFDLDRSRVEGKDFDIHITGGGVFGKDKRSGGEGEIRVVGGKFKGRDISGSFVNLLLRGDVIRGIYYVRDHLSGNLILEIPRRKLISAGSIFAGNNSLDFTFSGTPHHGLLGINLNLSIMDEEVRLKGTGSYEGRSFEFSLEPKDFTLGTFEVRFGGSKAKGNPEKGEVSFGGVEILILGREVVRVQPSKGVFNLEDKSFEMDFRFGGAVHGNFLVSYSSESGLVIESKGVLDLSKLSMFTYTPAGSRAEGTAKFSFSSVKGELRFELLTDDGVKIYSRYLSFPMSAWAELRAVGKDLSAFLTVWKNSDGISINVGSSGLRDYYIYLVSRNAPISLSGDNFRGDITFTSEGWFSVKELKKVTVNFNFLIGGEVAVKKKTAGESQRAGQGRSEREVGIETKLDIRFATDRPLRVILPEGYIYTKVKGWVGGTARDPEYSVVVEFVSGELTYFGRKFFVRGGTFMLVKEQGSEEKMVNLLIANTSDDLTIYINLKGSLDDPDLFIWSEPPMDRRELLSKLIIGSTAEGFFPVAEGLFKAFGSIGELRTGLSRTFGVDITLTTQTGSSGDLGFNVNIRKRLGRAFSIEYQQSTLRDPRSTFYGGSIRLPGGVHIYGRTFSDDTSEVKLRLLKKFDF